MIGVNDFKWVSTTRVSRKNAGVGLAVTRDSSRGQAVKTKIKLMATAMITFGLKVGDKVSIGYKCCTNYADSSVKETVSLCITKYDKDPLNLRRLQKSSGSPTESCYVSIYPAIDIDDVEFSLDEMSTEQIMLGENEVADAIIATKVISERVREG